MSDNKQALTDFIKTVEPSQTFFALQDPSSEEWLIVDSINFEQTDVMPVWSNEALANEHCNGEWSSYSVAPITLADWLEFWVEDLNQDNIIIGVNWHEEQDCLEVELAEFTQALIDIEAL